MYSLFFGQLFCIAVILFLCILVQPFNSLKSKNNVLDRINNLDKNKYLHPEFFGILHRLEDYSTWAQKEEFLVTVTKKRLLLVREEIKLMEKYLEDFRDSSGRALENLHKHVPSNTSWERSMVIASSSVLAHRMVHRYNSIGVQLKSMIGSIFYRDTNDLHRMELELPESSEEKFSSIFENDLYIGYDDVFMSMSALFKNQEIYGLKPDYFITGTDTPSLRNPKLTFGLSLKECIVIGIFALYRQKYYLAVEWLESAKNEKAYDLNISTDFTELIRWEYKDIVDFLLCIGIQEHNRELHKLENSKNCNDDSDGNFQNLFVNSITRHQSQHNRISLRDYLQNHKENLHKKSNNSLEPHIQFMKLCRGNFYRSPECTSKLKCFYESKLHPYLFICPVKVEQLSESPSITQYHNVIGANTIAKILTDNLGFMALMPPELEKIRPGVNAIEVDDRDRTSSGIGLKFDSLPKKIFKSAEIITGFNIWNGSDIATFAEYTCGRFYTYHGDVHAKDDKNREKTDVPKLKNNVGDDMDRMGTMLYYLEEPEEGGYTPFFQAGIASRPVKGSVVVWFNFYRNGTIRKDVYHGACPVLQGRKIMMHHWIRHESNWNRRKCSLNREE